MRLVVVHVLLLLIDCPKRSQSFRLVVVKRFPKKKFLIYVLKVPFKIIQLLLDGFACHFCGGLAAFCVFR